MNAARTPAGISYGKFTVRPSQSAKINRIPPIAAAEKILGKTCRGTSVAAICGAINPTKLSGPTISVAAPVRTEQ
ncbi:hypothetical protein Brsp01_28040 [Brucella sp. NBRC 12950]|nr:hypothetical protein Brsp01_28040 [Brucella sp. NBRC 12950]